MKATFQTYKRADLPGLVRVHNEAFPDDALNASDLEQRLSTVESAGGRIRLLEIEGASAGYALATPLSGLPSIWELHGCIAKRWRRKGFGRRLLNDLVGHLPVDALTLTHAVESTKSPTSQFLKKLGFSVEHDEWVMERDLPDCIESQSLPKGYRIATLSASSATNLFRAIYERCFAELPWYQPYPNDESVMAELVDSDDLIFLYRGSVPAGFLWLRWPEIGLGEIEPIGIVPEYQRQGLGRILMQAGMARIIDQGADRVRLGVWKINKPAIALYQSLGFQQVASQTHLALSLQSELSINL